MSEGPFKAKDLENFSVSHVDSVSGKSLNVSGEPELVDELNWHPFVKEARELAKDYARCDCNDGNHSGKLARDFLARWFPEEKKK